MASYFSITTADVERKLGFESGSIGAATVPVNDADVTSYVEDGEAEMRAVLTTAGVAEASLDAVTERQIVNAVKAYAAAEVIARVHGRNTDRYEAMRAEWLRMLDKYANRPNALRARSATRSASNVNSANTTTAATFRGRDYDGF